MSVIEDYLLKKSKIIVEYSKIIGDFITISNEQLWKNKAEFNKDLKELANNYINNFYFEQKKEEEPIIMADFIYLEEEDSLNKLLLFVVKNYQKKGINIQNFTLEIFYITMILNIGIMINDNNIKYKEIVLKIIKKLSTKKEFKIKKNINKYIIILSNAIKENKKNDEEFFKMFDMPEFYNEFKKIENKEYYVRYKYIINDSNYKQEYIDKIFKKQKLEESYSLLSYELLSLMLLKTKKDYIIKIPYELKNRINKINQIFYKKLRNRIKFLIEYNNSTKEKELIKVLKLNGYNIVAFANEEIVDNNVEFIKLNNDIGNDKYIKENEVIREENNNEYNS